jgi:hypothetical protein
MDMSDQVTTPAGPGKEARAKVVTLGGRYEARGRSWPAMPVLGWLPDAA